MAGKRDIPPIGEMRQSQIVNMFGPGALVDLPDHSVIIGGLDSWHGEMREITEERLEGELAMLLGRAVKLREPPNNDGSTAARQARGIRVFRFPRWYVAQMDENYTDPVTKKVYRTRPLIRERAIQRGKYRHRETNKSFSVVPVRFVQACTRGHVADVFWYEFVQNEAHAPMKGDLWLDEGGAANDFHEIYVRLVKGGKTVARRRLAEALAPGVLRTCPGRAPWLGENEKQPCKELSRLLQRGATHAYFTQKRSVISIPDASRGIREAVAAVYEDYFENADDVDDVAYNRKKQPKVTAALDGFTDQQVWSEIQRRRSGKKSGGPGKFRDYKREELETFRKLQPGERTDPKEPDFLASALRTEQIPKRYRDAIERIVLVENLREVVAQYGFTRFDDGMVDVTSHGPTLPVQPAWLAREPTWCPAVENRGEGFFIGFSDEAIAGWLEGRSGIGARRKRFQTAFQAWVKQRRLQDANLEFPGLAHVMVHSFSHLLLTAVSLECGYSSSSIRERVYAGPNGYGVLLYTASPGAEGTLGGLVEVGRNLERHLDRAMELGALCSNDPICAQHDPADAREERPRHGAACHGCLLIAETSCEWRNEYLDRSLVVPTVEALDCAMFEGL